MWTTKNRRLYDRSKLRYPSDLTDDEWAYVEPLIPPAKSGGNKRHIDVREVMNGIMYVLSTGCQWRAIPLEWCGLGRQIEAISLVAGQADLVEAEGGQIVDRAAEAVDRQAVVGAAPSGLALGRGRSLCRGNDRCAFGGGRGAVMVVEQQRREAASHVEFDVVGQHAHQDMSAHPRRGPMEDRADFQIDGLQAALAHLMLVEHGADIQADRGLAAQRDALAVDRQLDPAEVAFGRRQQGFALAPAFRRQQRIAADDQPLARIIRGADLGQIAIVEQR